MAQTIELFLYSTEMINMKKELVIFSVLLSLVSFGFLVFMAPYHLYSTIITEGVTSDIVKIEKQQKGLKSTKRPEFQNVVGQFLEDESRWQVFHFRDYHVPFPIRNPLFKVIPYIKWDNINKKDRQIPLGAKVLDSKNQIVFSFIDHKEVKYSYDLEDRKIFQLPFFKNLVLENQAEKIWKEIFTLDLSNTARRNAGLYETFLNARSISYRQLVYNFFIYHMRIKIKDMVEEGTIKSFSYFTDKSLGIVEISSDDPKMRREIVFTLKDGVINTFDMKTRKWSLEGKAIRNRFFKNFRYKLSTKDSSDIIYAGYKNLSYDRKIDFEGMAFLYASWSHVVDNKEFLEVMIGYLERGRENSKHMDDLYNYAFEKFGSTFSSIMYRKKENPMRMLERKISEEEQKRTKRLKDKKMIVPDNFENDYDEEEYNLIKAKEDPAIDDRDEGIIDL
jgi:hypothetical protein